MEPPAWTYTHATEMRDHWWWRPGWAVGRRFYTWHYTFEGQGELHRLVAAYQDGLADMATLDMVPIQWLHLTVQGLGFAGEMDEGDLAAIDDAVGIHLNRLATPKVTFERPVVRPEAIALPPAPLEPLIEAKAAIRRGIADVWGDDRVPELLDGFQPHVTLAYSSGAGNVPDIRSRLDAIEPAPASVELGRPRLIRLNRDRRVYAWA